MNPIESFIPDILMWSTITGAIIQVVKIAAKDKIPNNFYPLLSLVLGFAIGFVVLGWAPLVAIILGVVASGGYDLIKQTPLAVRDQVEKMQE